jgi:Uma2 family endonuclease
MSTITPTRSASIPRSPAPPEASVPSGYGDHRVVFRRVDWHTYHQLSESLGDNQHVHLIYDGKDLEIVVISYIHDILKGLIIKIVNALVMALDVDCLDTGQATWRTMIRGLEADLSYYFEIEKIGVAQEAWARNSKDPNDYPRPDMAVEIDQSPPQVDRPAIFRDLRVFEVWRFVRGEALIIEQLQPDGTYAAVEESQFLRVRPEEILRWVKAAATERPAVWNRRLNRWAMGLARRVAQHRRRAGKPAAKRKAKGNGKKAD